MLSVVRVDTPDEAIAVVNRSRFGNGASIVTENRAAVRRYRHDVQAGMVGVNIGVGDLHAHGPDAVEQQGDHHPLLLRRPSQPGVLREEPAPF